MIKSNRAIRLDFSKHIKAEFLKMSDHIMDYINSITPKEQELITFGIHSYDDGKEDKFKVASLNGDMVYGWLDDISWNDLENNVKGLASFCDKYSLGRSFTFAGGNAVPPHRHYYTLNSLWSISIFKGSSSGRIKFYKSKDSGGARENLSNMGTFEDFDCVEQIKSNIGDFFSIRTWSWHGWLADDPNTSNHCIVFYMKDADSYNATLKAIEKIKNS